MLENPPGATKEPLLPKTDNTFVGSVSHPVRYQMESRDELAKNRGHATIKHFKSSPLAPQTIGSARNSSRPHPTNNYAPFTRTGTPNGEPSRTSPFCFLPTRAPPWLPTKQSPPLNTQHTPRENANNNFHVRLAAARAIEPNTFSNNGTMNSEPGPHTRFELRIGGQEEARTTKGRTEE